MGIKIAVKLIISVFFIASFFLLFSSRDALANPCGSNPSEGDCKQVSELGQSFNAYKKTMRELNHLGCVRKQITPSGYVVQPHGMRYVKTHHAFLPEMDEAIDEHFKFFCPPEVVEHQLIDRGNLVTGMEAKLIWLINNIIIAIMGIFLWLFDWSSHAMLQMISAGTYMNHHFVQNGWPFIQGVANLGFILALLFIAAATTLHLDIGGGIKRLLPRLLIAALLINFSLVIGALIIDASRLLMAIEVNILTRGQGGVEDFGKQILEGSQLTTVAAKGANPGGYSWALPVEMAQKTLLIAALAIGMFYAAILLVIRHIALILLLLFSPIAYLAFAIPKADGLARRWWTEFIKWTLYGPILLFFIILIAFYGTGYNEGSERNPIPFATAAMNVGITSAMLIMAGKFGTMLAGAGGAAAIGMTTRGAKRAGSWARRNPYKAAAIAGTVATGGLGGAALGAGGLLAGKGAYKGVAKTKEGAVNQAKDVGRTMQNNYASRMRDNQTLRRIMPARRNQDGTLRPGETSLGSSVGERLSPARSRDVADLRDYNRNTPVDQQTPAHGTFRPERLLRNDVRNELSPQQVDMIATHDDSSAEQRQIILSDVGSVQKMSNPVRSRIITQGDNEANQLLRTLREIDRRSSSNN